MRDIKQYVLPLFYSSRLGVPIDVYSVPDRITGLQGLSVLNPNRKWNFVHINITKEELQRTRLLKLIFDRW